MQQSCSEENTSGEGVGYAEYNAVFGGELVQNWKATASETDEEQSWNCGKCYDVLGKKGHF